MTRTPTLAQPARPDHALNPLVIANTKGATEMKTVQELEDLYRSDPTVNQIVHWMMQLLDTSTITPAELRQIAVFAASRWEFIRQRNGIFEPKVNAKP